MAYRKAQDTFDLWPGRSPPCPGETLSSWFTRIALSNGLSPKELFPICVPGARLYQLDLDRFPPRELVECLSKHTGVSEGKIRKLNLNQYLGTVFSDQPAKSRLPWIPPAGTAQKCFGQQICPECLRDDRRTHYRLHWRLYFVADCHIRHNILIDRCPYCGGPVSVLRVPDGGGLEFCAYCGGSYLGGEQTMGTVEESSLLIQRNLLSVAGGNWVQLGERHVHPVLFFKALHHLFRLVAGSQFATDLQEVLAGLSGIDLERGSIPKFKEVERYNPRCRQILLQLTMKLIDRWPTTLVQVCKEVGLSRRRLLNTGHDLPFELTRQVDEHLSFPKFELTKDDIQAASRVLERRGTKPTYRELQKLLNHRFPGHRKLSKPVAKRTVPCGFHRYWKLEGISPQVRQAAKEAAKQAGENIGPWIEGVLRRELNGRKR